MKRVGWLLVGLAASLLIYVRRREIQGGVENMLLDVKQSVDHPNVQRMLKLIRVGEGTSDDNGYRRLVGGGEFDSFADHPRTVQAIKFSNGKTLRSSAAGAFQFLRSTWDEMKAKYDLPDFSPASQDIAAVGLLKRSGALAHVLDGDFATAIRKANKVWASLPESPYGQPTLTMAKAGEIIGETLA